MELQVEADLPPSLACLKGVDTLLRCPICFDFLNITVMTKCSHNFCSLCIRKFLSYKLQCPVCNAEATQHDLRNNRILDDLVLSFQAARQQLSKVTFDTPPISPSTPGSAVKCRTPRQRGLKCNSSVLSHFFQKRSKASPAEDTAHDSGVPPCVQRGRRQPACSHNANEGDLHSAPPRLPVVVKEEPPDEEEASVTASVKREDAGSRSVSAGDDAAPSSSLSIDVKPIIKVECPVCSVSVSQQFINKHLDTCLTRGEKKESLRSSLSKGRQPMGKVVYNLLSMQELKRRLKECKLSAQGSRDQLIKRHQEFVLTYNAQCDSLDPKSAADIAKEVEANEKIRNRLQGKTKPVMVFSKNQSETEIDEMHSNYRKQHSSDFSRLVAQVRGQQGSARKTRIKHEDAEEGEDVPRMHSADQTAGSKSHLTIKAEEAETDEEATERSIDLSPSPSNSCISVSSSLSDIFGPEPATLSNMEETERTSGQKLPLCSRGESTDPSPANLAKRRRQM